MQAFGVFKTKPSRSSIPVVPRPQRLLDTIAAIESDPNNEAMVACSECVKHNVACFYSRENSVKCTSCLKNRRTCDGTFSLEKFRRVGDQKRDLKLKSLSKRREIRSLRSKRVLAHGALLEARENVARLEQELMSVDKELVAEEEADIKFNDDLEELEEKSKRMLQREMQALGVLEQLPAESEVAFAEPDTIWREADEPQAGTVPDDLIDWNAVLNSGGSQDHQVPAL